MRSRTVEDVLPMGAALFLSICLCMVSHVSAETQHCLDINNNDATFNPDQMEGTWYPIDIILHRNDSKIYGVPIDSHCPWVTVALAPKSKTKLTMVWNSTEGFVEYKFSPKGKGQWQANVEQKGTLVTEDYKQYGGILRVVKLDEDKMFLTYCSIKSRVLSSVVFSKSGEMDKRLIDEAKAELARKKININSSKEIIINPCNDGGYSHRVLSSCLMSILPSLVVRFPL